MNTENNIFEIKDVSYSYLGKFPALCGMNLAIHKGERIALLGANGSGKSSLLHLLNGLAFPQEGEIRFFGQRLSEESLKDKTFNSYFRKTVGLVFQNSDIQLFSSNVWDEIAFGPTQLDLSTKEVKERVDDLLRMLNIENLRDRPPYQLSGGEKKKVAIASTLAINPDVLLLDEPTIGLDPRTKTWLVELLEALHRTGKTIITATHDLSTVERISDRAVILKENHCIAAEGKSCELLKDKTLLSSVNLIHVHIHRHAMINHEHDHGHFPEHEHLHNNKLRENL